MSLLKPKLRGGASWVIGASYYSGKNMGVAKATCCIPLKELGSLWSCGLKSGTPGIESKSVIWATLGK